MGTAKQPFFVIVFIDNGYKKGNAARKAAIEVCEVEEDTEIMPDKVCVMPENKVVAIKDIAENS